MTKHLYFYLEDLALTVPQRNTLVTTVRNYGEENASIYPHRRIQFRTRLDSKAVIFEAVFQENQLTAAHFKTVLANIFNVSETLITYSVANPSYGQLVTYSYSSTPRLRFGVFGGAEATWEESRSQAHAYIIANQTAWESL